MTVFRFSNLGSHVFKYIFYTGLCIIYIAMLKSFLVWMKKKRNEMERKNCRYCSYNQKNQSFFNSQTSFSFLLCLSTDYFFVDKSPLQSVHLLWDLEEPCLPFCFFLWHFFFLVSFLNPFASPALAALTTRIFTTNIVVHLRELHICARWLKSANHWTIRSAP